MAARPPELTRHRASEVRRRLLVPLAGLPAAAWLCALAAFLNVAAWSILTPPFQVPDEQAHYAYAEYLAQHGRPPVPADTDAFSDSQAAALAALRFETVRFFPFNASMWSSLEQTSLQRALLVHDERSGGNGAAHTVGGEPPLYYALEGIPYRLAAGGNVLQRLMLMRLLSAVLGAATVGFVFLFLREALPGHPWSWTVGALGVAFQPMFAFVSGGVNSDALFYAAAAATFFLLARGFRRGMTSALTVAVGIAMAVGLTTKFNGLGLLPGVALALVAMAVRDEGGLRLRALRLPALALAVALAPTLLEMALNALVWERPAIGASASAFALSDAHFTIGGALGYAWQFYLVPLPGQDALLGPAPLWDQWITGFLARFGWVDTRWSQTAYRIAFVPLLAVTALAARTLVVRRRAVRLRRVELTAYAAIALSFALFVAGASYVIYLRFDEHVAQARYLLPLLPLYGGLLALAVAGAGRRWATVAGCTIVALAIGHDVLAYLLVVSRYYV